MRARGEVCKRNIKLNNLRKMELDALQFWNSGRVNGRRFKFWEGDDSEDIVGIILSRRVSCFSRILGDPPVFSSYYCHAHYEHFCFCDISSALYLICLCELRSRVFFSSFFLLPRERAPDCIVGFHEILIYIWRCWCLQCSTVENLISATESQAQTLLFGRRDCYEPRTFGFTDSNRKGWTWFWSSLKREFCFCIVFWICIHSDTRTEM